MISTLFIAAIASFAAAQNVTNPSPSKWTSGLSEECQSKLSKFTETVPATCLSVMNKISSNSTTSLTGILDVLKNVDETLNAYCPGGACADKVQEGIDILKSDVCGEQGKNAASYSTVISSAACVKSGDQYCLTKEVQEIVPILSSGGDINSKAIGLIGNKTFLCTQCIASQLQAVVAVPDKSPETNGIVSTLEQSYKSTCPNGPIQSSANQASATAVFLFGTFVIASIAF